MCGGPVGPTNFRPPKCRVSEELLLLNFIDVFGLSPQGCGYHRQQQTLTRSFSGGHMMPRRYLTAGIIFCLIVSCACQAVSAAEPKRVLIIDSFGRDFAPWNEYVKRFRADLDRQLSEPLDLYETSLAIPRFSDESKESEPKESQFIDYLHSLFGDRRLDLIVTIGAPAAQFAQRNRVRLFPTTPLLLGILDKRWVPPESLTTNDTVLAASVDQIAVVENILRVRPQTTHVAVVIGNSPTEKYWLGQLQETFQSFRDRVAFTWLNELSLADMEKRVEALPPRSAVYFFLLAVDAAGVPHEEQKALNRLNAVSNSPIFSFSDSSFGHGIVGGPLISVEDYSRQTANIAVRLLRGEAPSDVRMPPVGLSTPKFDWREMQRWGIPESRLPLGSEIYFRDPTAWELYRLQIIAICAALLAQAALVGWLFYEIGRRRRAEIQSRSSMAELTYMDRRASAEQRSAALAHEISQPLAGIATRASAALRWLRMEKPDIAKAETALESIVTASQRASEIIASVRAMFRKGTSERAPIDINRIILTVLGLVRIDLKKNGVELRTQLDEKVSAVEGDKVQLQQVVLNLVMNAVEAMQSAQTRVLKVQTDQVSPGMVRVSVEDTGTGIDPSNIERIFKPFFTTKANGMGMGLVICRSIIENHDGRIWASPRSNGGSIFQFELPTSATPH
jgi:signal transduction histidine kinase